MQVQLLHALMAQLSLLSLLMMQLFLQLPVRLRLLLMPLLWLRAVGVWDHTLMPAASL